MKVKILSISFVFGCLATKHVTELCSLLYFNSSLSKNNESKSYCYISCSFGEKERGRKMLPQFKVSKISPSTNGLNICLDQQILIFMTLVILMM